MKTIQLTKEAITKLYFILNVLFPEFKHIEIVEKPFPYVTFSSVPKNSILSLFGSKYVTKKIPIAELFISEIPKRFSIYQFKNDSMMPIYFISSAVLIADNPEYLVEYYHNKLKDIRPAHNENYKTLFKKLNNLETHLNDGNYGLIKGFLKSLSPDIIGSSKMFNALIIKESIDD